MNDGNSSDEWLMGQIAQGSQVSDPDGTRIPTLFIPAGVSAELEMPDGSRVPVDSFTVHATEYSYWINAWTFVRNISERGNTKPPRWPEAPRLGRRSNRCP